MNIAKVRDEIAAMVRSVKEGHLAGMHDPNIQLGETDIRNAVHGFRGENPVVSFMPWQTDRDKTLYAAYVAAVAFGCDVLSFTTESWHPAQEHTERNPYTGKPWAAEEHSMQKAVEQHNALEEGVMTESLMTMVINRAGDMTTVLQDYKITKRTSVLGITTFQIEWAEPAVLDNMIGEGGEIGGYVPQQLQHFMTLPTIQQEILHSTDRIARQLMAELGPTRAQAHQDCATVKYLFGHEVFEGGIILLSNDPERAEVIQESLGEGGLGFATEFGGRPEDN